MKIKDLDRNEVYGLEEIKKDAIKFDMLKKWLVENTEYYIGYLKDLDNYPCIKYMDYLNKWFISSKKPTKCALTLFDLDITDYQVDCSELSDVEINNLADIVKSKGLKLWDDSESLLVNNHFYHFNHDGSDFGIYGENYDKTTITYDKFIELFGEKELTKEQLIESVSDSIKKETDNYLENLYDIDCTIDQGYKESNNKCNYELDFEFIQDLAMRIQNEPKYEPYNWQKTMNVEQLSNAMLRHAIEVKKGNFDDNGELGHLLAVAANAMFIYYQKKHHNE